MGGNVRIIEGDSMLGRFCRRKERKERSLFFFCSFNARIDESLRTFNKYVHLCVVEERKKFLNCTSERVFLGYVSLK